MRIKIGRLSILGLLLFCLLSAVDADQKFSLSIVSQNMHRLIDDVDDGNKSRSINTKIYQKRLDLAAMQIISIFSLPDIIALQEVENIKILQHLADRIQWQTKIKYQPVLIEGNDISGIDVGYLVQSSWRIKSSRTLFQHQQLKINLNPLFSRPPLLIEICKNQQCLTLVNLHLRSMRGIRSGKSSYRNRQKRLKQAETLARWVQEFQTENPNHSLLLIGDFNALKPSDPYVDSIGIIQGVPDQQRPEMKSADLVEPNLVDLSLNIPINKRYSFRYKKRKQQLDYLMVNQSFAYQLKNIRFGRINRRFSDHAALLAEFE